MLDWRMSWGPIVGMATGICLSMTADAAPLPLVSRPPSYDQDIGGFVSAKGERALIMGYPAELEVWTYPLQLVSAYHVRFRVPGQIDAIDAAPLLRRVERTATEVVRTYVGADYTVRERLFAPRTQAGALLRYEVEGRPDVRIEASFVPSLNLMWPAALGGQTVAWDEARTGYVEREPLHPFSATIASHETVEHDGISNSTRQISDRLTMLLQPVGPIDGVRVATLAFARDPGANADGAAAMLASEANTRADAQAHASDLLARSIEIETSDPEINRALASATLALDQAWACEAELGCGELAGFGPSRPGRRPQYAWFFAGDGMIAMEAMLDAGQFERAREELAFVTRYQDPKTGMIWHEMSQSAGLIDWVGRYPYMYVHVDISFQYLAALSRYVAATGDIAFARQNWQAIEKAWRYCTSVIDAGSGLPHIPAGKQGQNEQDKLRDDIRLSSLWVDAADGFADLAASTGHRMQADAGRHAATRARQAIGDGDWDTTRQFWISGHSLSGAPVPSERSDAIGVLDQGIFAPDQIDHALDRIASPDFLADWGVRSMAASDPAYDPNLYSAGSVWALGSAAAADSFWHQHRPLTAWRIWRALVGWNRIDSAGHLPEVLAGDLYHPEREAVPEQTWSSAGLLSSAVHGLLGLERHAAGRALTIAPHLPAGMDDVTVRHVRIGETLLDLTLHRASDGIDLVVENPGPTVNVTFDPMVPLGASINGGTVAGQPASVLAEHQSQDEHARVQFEARTGRTTAHIGYRGGIVLEPVQEDPRPGSSSHAPIISDARVSGHLLTIDGWAMGDYPADIGIETNIALSIQSGGVLTSVSPGHYRLLSPKLEGSSNTLPRYDRFTTTIKTGSDTPSPDR
jgi:glycogen debranching enzyme